MENIEFLEKLVQNYYELNGNFIGVVNKKFYSKVTEYAINNNLSGNDALYNLLGYKSTEDWDSLTLFEIRRSYNLGDKLDKIAKTSRISLDILESKEKEWKPISVGKAHKIKDTLVNKYAFMISDYYNSNENNLAFVSGSIVQFPFYVERVRLESGNRMDKINKILNNEELITNLIKLVKIEGQTDFINDGVLYYSQELKDSELEQIKKLSVEYALFPEVGLSNSIASKTNIFVRLSNSDVNKYLSILENCTANKMTYAELLGRLGFNTPDYSIIYDKTGVVPIIMGESVTILAETGVTTMDLQVFNDVYSSSEFTREHVKGMGSFL